MAQVRTREVYPHELHGANTNNTYVGWGGVGGITMSCMCKIRSICGPHHVCDCLPFEGMGNGLLVRRNNLMYSSALTVSL